MKTAKNYYQALIFFSIIACTSNQILSAQNLTPIQVGDKWGFADSTGKVIIDILYLEVKNFTGPITGVKIRLGEWIFIDKTGNKVDDNTYYFIGDFYDGLAIVKTVRQVNFKTFCSFVDSTGKHVTETEYEFLDRFSEGPALAQLNKKWGYIDTSMKIAIPFIYDCAQDFKAGLAAVSIDAKEECYSPWDNSGGKWGFINKAGEIVIPFLYDYCTSYENG